MALGTCDIEDTIVVPGTLFCFCHYNLAALSAKATIPLKCFTRGGGGCPTVHAPLVNWLANYSIGEETEKQKEIPQLFPQGIHFNSAIFQALEGHQQLPRCYYSTEDLQLSVELALAMLSRTKSLTPSPQRDSNVIEPIHLLYYRRILNLVDISGQLFFKENRLVSL